MAYDRFPCVVRGAGKLRVALSISERLLHYEKWSVV